MLQPTRSAKLLSLSHPRLVLSLGPATGARQRGPSTGDVSLLSDVVLLMIEGTVQEAIGARTAKGCEATIHVARQ